MTQTFHQLRILLTPRLGTGVALQPIPERGIEGPFFLSGPQPGSFDQFIFGAEGYILHINSVHYFSVTSRPALVPQSAPVPPLPLA